MPTNLTESIKDLLYNLERYIYWCDLYQSDFEYTALAQERKHYQRLSVLLPPILNAIKDNDFDAQCG